MPKKKDGQYTSDSIKTLETYKAIRKRYGMYIGSNGQIGCLRLFYEAIGNAIDEFSAGRCKNILVKIDAKKNEIQISDDGIGLFQDKIEQVCTELHSGGKFDNDYSKYSIGQNGVGLTVINALSESLMVLVKRDGYSWKQTFSKGLPTSKLQKLEKLSKSDHTGTTITFIPDIEVMEDISMDIKQYLEDVTMFSYMNKGLTFNFIGIDEKGNKINKTLLSKNGMDDYMKVLDKGLLLSKNIKFEDSTEYERVIKNKSGKEIHTEEMISMECEITMQFSKNDTNIIKSYCNGLATKDGGSHVTGFKMALTEFFTKAIKDSNLLTKKDGKIEIIADDIQEGLIALIVTKHSEAVFKSQTKDELNVEQIKWWIKKITIDYLTDWVKKNSSQAKLIYQRIIAAAKGRMAATRAKTAKKQQESSIFSGLSSLSKITLATSDDPSKRRMFIVEGDSAGGGAIDARCPETDSIAKLRGKPLNTYDISPTKLDANKEFSDIAYALGCGIDSHFDESKLTHQQIIAMADADIDGCHITSLLAVYFFKHMKPIIENGKFYIASPPLYEVKENGKAIFFNNQTTYNQYITDRIMKKYTIGKVIKKDGKSVCKKFTKDQIVEFLNNTKTYNTKLKNISSLKSLHIDIIEFILNNMNDMDILPNKIEKKFTEIKCTVDKKTKMIHIEGMHGNNYQMADLDKDFFDSISDIHNFIISNKYINLYYKTEDSEIQRTYIGNLLKIILDYGTPKYRKRFKGLGEMDYDELWYTTMRPDSKNITRVKAKSMHDLANVLETHFGNDPEKRKIFLKNFEISPEDIDN